MAGAAAHQYSDVALEGRVISQNIIGDWYFFQFPPRSSP